MDKWKCCLLELVLLISIPLAGKSVNRPIVMPASDEELERRTREKSDLIPLGPVRKVQTLSSSPLTWNFLGPEPILGEYWSGYDPASGRVCAIIVNPSNPDNLYLAGAQGGVWKSIDNGVNWTSLTDQLSSLASGALAFDPFDPDIIYYGTGEQHYSADSFYGDGLFKSTDGGNTWTKISLYTQVGYYIARILVKPTDSNLLHLASNLGYLRSTDGGATWNAEISSNHCNDIVLSPGAPSTLFAGIRTIGIFKSTDDGASWTQLTSALPDSGFRRINLAISQSDTNVVYASFVSISGSLLGMYKTTDGGASWFDLPNTPNYLWSQGWYDNCVIVDPTNPNICYAGGVFPYSGPGSYGMIKTTDGGNSWSDITIGTDGSQLHPDQHILAFGPDGSLWVGNDGGIWKTMDGGQTWINRNNTLGITQFYTVGIHPTSDTFLLGGTQDNGTLRYFGSLGWAQVIEGDGGPCLIEWDSPNIYYTSYVRLYPVWKWNNGGYMGNVAWWGGERASWANGPLITDPNQPNTLLVGTYHIWRTTNSGASWDTLSGDITGGAGYHLRSIAVAQGNSDIIYSGSSGGRVYVTTDGGTNWNLRNTGLPTLPIPDIFLDPGDWQTAYICVDRSFGGRVFKTTDAGVNWMDITGDLPPLRLRGLSLAVNFGTTPPTLYLGTDYGIYSSINDGTNWVKEDTSLPNVAIYDMGYDGVNNFLVAATHGRGMWRAGTPVGIEEGNEKLAISNAKLALFQNKPNPFSSTTLIRYILPGVGAYGNTPVQGSGISGQGKIPVRLAIYDITGRLVETLVDEPQKPGIYHLPFTNYQLPGSGIYFYRLKVGNSSHTKKLILLR